MVEYQRLSVMMFNKDVVEAAQVSASSQGHSDQQNAGTSKKMSRARVLIGRIGHYKCGWSLDSFAALLCVLLVMYRFLSAQH